MGQIDKYKTTKYNYTYEFSLPTFPLKFVKEFLIKRGYRIVNCEDTDIDDRDMEINIAVKLCAIKINETPNLWANEINGVFVKEFQQALLTLLLHANAEDMAYILSVGSYSKEKK